MAAANPAEALRDEATCSICLEYFTDPVSVECGHNFCRPCIAQYWEGMDRNFPCPQCRKRTRKRSFRPNRQLANMTEMEQLQSCLKSLRKELMNVQAFQTKEQERTRKLKENVEIQRQRIVSEFEELNRFLRLEKQGLLDRLAEEEGEILQQLDNSILGLAKQNSLLENTIRELEEKYHSAAIDLLEEVKSALSRGEEMKCQEPEPVDTEIKKNAYNYPLQYFTLKNIIKKLNVSFVALDPETANQSLILSEDRKSARVGEVWRERPVNPRRFEDSSSVLGCEGFTSGTHYWEVGVGDGRIWIVGAAEESVSRRGGITSSTDRGIWAVNLIAGHYRALTSPASCLTPSESPNKLGVYLDYEGGRLSFHNGDTMEHLYTFTSTFTRKSSLSSVLGPGTEIRL
ncbi:E3 ubiquitin-protein ligase TRIM39-like isoform X2 [Rhinatrema bivittatum]|uniref:E3 ubiquitin-protein ligase TRIM39-like isoform X2 n=1 Tax=Rhinatrema bivittatum TaxID=194408 RepID=UPI00112A8E5D|nr:E3 ubiquitin-protein ligase TRIM39-like isoform X2 [Rhinatrema bivittatum]